ncbi:MAG TPA: TM1812 family CRISPR-associated protein [Candidatus Eremiobacteraeota bacterium]|nr:TM1812 family CRISPR-associated protein [Candidatus Eremiobacteraeota bacterium]
MNNTFISVLGTNNYLECRYNNGGIVKYIQEDLIKRYCIDRNEVDEIRIFLTKEARTKNWEDIGLDR